MAEAPLLIVRFPVLADLGATFEAGGALLGRTSLPELGGHHDPRSGRFTMVAEVGGEVAGVATITITPDSLRIDFLARNRFSGLAKGRPVGEPLLEAAEELASRMARTALTLESVDDPDTLAFYRRFGFRAFGPPSEEPGRGRLHPMRKDVSWKPWPTCATRSTSPAPPRDWGP